MNRSDTLKQYLKNKHIGKENAITSKKIEKELGYDGISIRQIVNQLRRSGVPICSDTNGYYYAANNSEIKRTIEQLEHRLDGISNALKGLKTNLV